MSAHVKKIQCHPLFPIIMAGASYTFLTIVSSACLFYYFTQMVNNEFTHWHLIGYILMLANGLSGYSEFIDEDSFCPLRDLLDYCQIVLVLPCYAAEMWLKTEMGPPEISAVHAGLGFLAAIMYVILEYRRQDLTDLAVFSNATCLMFIAVLAKNPITLLAVAIFLYGYAYYKRKEDQCCMAPQDKFNFIMALFAVVALASLDDATISSIQDGINSGLEAIGIGGAGGGEE